MDAINIRVVQFLAQTGKTKSEFANQLGCVAGPQCAQVDNILAQIIQNRADLVKGRLAAWGRGVQAQHHDVAGAA